jgi:hypothetical protein
MWTRSGSDTGSLAPLLMLTFLLLLETPMTCDLAAPRRPALFPPKGEQKEKREAVEPVRHRVGGA